MQQVPQVNSKTNVLELAARKENQETIEIAKTQETWTFRQSGDAGIYGQERSNSNEFLCKP